MNLRNHCSPFVLFSLEALRWPRRQPNRLPQSESLRPSELFRPMPLQHKGDPCKSGQAHRRHPTKPPSQAHRYPRAQTYQFRPSRLEHPTNRKSRRAIFARRIEGGEVRPDTGRYPQRAIDALSQKPKPEKGKNKVISERFRLLANAGRWSELGRYIKSLPHNQTAETAYRH